MRPLIGVTSAWSYETWGDSDKDNGNYYVGKPYVEAIYKAGGIPMILHPRFEEQDIDDLVSLLDGILFTGGGSARRFTPEDLPSLELQQETRYRFEKDLLIKAREAKLPILGICRGYQMIIEVFGGSLSDEVIQGHKQATRKYEPHHKVYLEEESILYSIIQDKVWDVNSLHIQEAENIPEDFIVSAKTEDNVIEAIEGTNSPFIMGLQFHPELMSKDPKGIKIFKYFIEEAKSID